MKIASKKILAPTLCLLLALAPRSAGATLEAIPGVPSKSIQDVLGDMTKWLIGFGVTLCVLMIIWGGLNYVASVGDEERIKQAKKTIHYAIWGIAIIGLSYAMLKVINDVLI